jgi:hypothetical protein
MCAATALGGPAAAATWGRAVEPPPAIYASGPTVTGTTRELTFPTPQAVQAFCNLYLGRPASGYYQACYVPVLDLVVLPDSHAWPSATERAELRAHEWAHARGWRHPAPAVTYAASAGARADLPTD